MGIKVWIDQDLCTGDGICVEICPKIFEMHDDGLAYVKQEAWTNRFGESGTGEEPKLKMSTGLADVRDGLLEDVVEAAEACPGECIFIEME